MSIPDGPKCVCGRDARSEARLFDFDSEDRHTYDRTFYLCLECKIKLIDKLLKKIRQSGVRGVYWM